MSISARIQPFEAATMQRIEDLPAAHCIKGETAAMFKVEITSGKDLKSLRESQGLDLDDVHRLTKISHVVLKTIEKDDIAHLPPTFYLKNFLKSYAEILHVDTDAVVEGYLKNVGKG
jgi:hypothetical protein